MGGEAAPSSIGGLARTLSLVIPASNEEARLPALLEVLADSADAAVAEAGLELIEILIVDDGSTDRTAEMLRAAAVVKALDDERQQRIVDELRASSRPCAIRSTATAELWLNGYPVPQGPLVSYINDFRPVEQVGEFESMLPKATIAKP